MERAALRASLAPKFLEEILERDTGAYSELVGFYQINDNQCPARKHQYPSCKNHSFCLLNYFLLLSHQKKWAEHFMLGTVRAISQHFLRNLINWPFFAICLLWKSLSAHWVLKLLLSLSGTSANSSQAFSFFAVCQSKYFLWGNLRFRRVSKQTFNVAPRCPLETPYNEIRRYLDPSISNRLCHALLR